jgi:uncharacterized pyridoxal phosphate-containing UPF0001 family protein
LPPRDAANGPAASVQLLAVSKTFPAPKPCWKRRAAGQRAFGENYLQEGARQDRRRARKARADPAGVAFHRPDPEQQDAADRRHFDWVHTVERLKIAQRLSEQRPPDLAPLNICLQVNISGEASKSGVDAGGTAGTGAPGRRAAEPAPARPDGDSRAADDPATAARRVRAACARCSNQLRAGGLALDTLSMGMSADMRAAIAEGATIVRVGSAIFGARHYE